MEETIANTQARLAAADTKSRANAHANYMRARASPQPNSIANTIAKTKARLAAENAERRAKAYANLMRAKSNPQASSIANTIAQTKARLAKEEANNRERRAKASQKWLGTQARLNKAAADADHPDCEAQGLVTFSETKVVPSRWQNGVEKRRIDRCVTPEELSRLEATKQASSRASSPVASPVYSNSSGSTTPTSSMSVKNRMKLFQRGGDMASWEAYLAAQRRINETRREGIRPIRIPNVKFNTSSPSTPTSPSSPMSVKNRIKFFENRRKSVGGKTRKNKSRKSKTKKSRRN